MTNSKIESLLSGAGLDRVGPLLLGMVSESLRLKTRPADDGQLALGVTKLGGLPDLPADTPWPTNNGIPLAFLAQVRLSDVHPYPAAQGLPAAGLLSFFYDARQTVFGDQPGDRDAWQVLYQPAEKIGRLERLAAPAALPAASRFKACALELSEERTLPQDPVFFQPNLKWAADEQDRYDDMRFQHLSDRSFPRHRLLGHPDVIQDDMHLQCQWNAHGVTGAQDPRASQLASGASHWQLLLQVDSDGNSGMQWGSSGMLYYWIEADALRAGNFTNVWLVLQSE